MIPFELGPIIVGLIGLGILLLFLAMGMPVSFAMALVGFAGFACLTTTKAAFLAFDAELICSGYLRLPHGVACKV